MTDLYTIWNAAGKSKRELMRRYWPELADALDDLSMAKDFGEAIASLTTVQCDGCFNIERMRKNLNPHDEDAAYRFQRAARYHRKECPNR